MAVKSGASGAQRKSRSALIRPLAIAVSLALPMAFTPVFTAAQTQGFAFDNVTIEGNDRVDAATILSYAGIARGQAVSAGDLNDAYQRIVNAGLFETVELVRWSSASRNTRLSTSSTLKATSALMMKNWQKSSRLRRGASIRPAMRKRMPRRLQKPTACLGGWQQR
jgi:hypothetical protein